MSFTNLRSLLGVAALSSAALLSLSASEPAVAWAQEDDRVADLIELVRKRPSGKDRDAWRDERRDAARELGTLGDTRAVPVLIEIVKTEQFDAVGEIAIVSLGKLGDERAVPVLQEVADDSSRDRFVRKAARSALKKLGAQPATGDDDDDDDVESVSTGGLAGSGLGSVSVASPTASTEVRLAPDFGDDMLAASDQLTFGVGDGAIRYDSVRKQASFDGEAAARYLRIRERKSMALRLEGRGSVVGGFVNYDGEDSSSRIASVNAAGAAQVRFYEGSGRFFGIGSASALLGFDHLRVNRPGDDNTSRSNYLSGELDVFLGGGYGRILNKGESLRVKRIEAVLKRRKLLGRPIRPDLAERIMRAWWMLRTEIGFHDRLVATVGLLREAGVLLGEPDAGTSYAILQVLRDGQLSHRQDGLQVHLGIGESVLMRDDELGLEEGRIETVSSRVSYGRQNAEGDSEVRAEGFARYRILAEEGEAGPWSAIATVNWRDYRYGPNFDPIGALDLGIEAGASNDGLDDSELATRIGGSVGWLWVPSRASRFRVAAAGRLEASELFLGITFEGQYGLIDAGFVGASAAE